MAWLHWVKCIWVYCAHHSQSTHYIWFPKLIRGFFFSTFYIFEALISMWLGLWGAAFEVWQAQKRLGSGAGAPGTFQQHTVLLLQLPLAHSWLRGTVFVSKHQRWEETQAEQEHRWESFLEIWHILTCENFRRFLSVPIWNRFWHFHEKRSCSFLLLHTVRMNELCVCINNHLMCNHQFVLKCNKYFPIKTPQHNALYIIKHLLAVILRSNFPFLIWTLIRLLSIQNVKSIRHRLKWTRK